MNQRVVVTTVLAAATARAVRFSCVPVSELQVLFSGGFFFGCVCQEGGRGEGGSSDLPAPQMLPGAGSAAALTALSSPVCLFVLLAPPSDDPLLRLLHLRPDRRHPQLPVRAGAEQAARRHAVRPSGRHDAGLSG